MIARFSYADLAVSRWRNGGGETREIVSFPPGAESFSWRASIATLAQDGPFSAFPGIDRIITLLHGDPVLLTAPGTEHRLMPQQPWAFTGELALTAQLQGSVSEDFNIMTRRGEWQATVEVVTAPVSSLHGVAWVLAGAWQTADGRRLTTQRGAWWVDEETQLSPCGLDARLLFTRLNRVP
ncbi:HutD family protein [Pantoea sp. Bo_2]|uniref:HutD/Ves family protein n=1 Tax=unclassified Pantoea TaxID=2630326 RepID=UPI001232EE17|nr:MULTISPECIES: HutD family protein [unclassified Pantoea]KAA5947067.1 HutD family protein [Pantoea sp. VH_3]KAA5952328.1 HutD family protein [Pantoea sp. VH_25]KAA5954493.1 HutD family protein [Pantoea sp. VH_24]KAA5961596.1 HutD family protein [Pantoea sp. VH_16]KAA5965742.1 HutD family protein [Pantoea sp. VH_18]